MNNVVVTVDKQEAQLLLRNRASAMHFVAMQCVAKSRVLGLSVGEDFVILTYIVFTQCQRVTARQTETVGQRDGLPIVANTELCIASYADDL